MEIKIGTIADVVLIDSQIPEFAHTKANKDKFERRLNNKDNLILIAVKDKKVVAYKIGYALSDTTFYSWLGGVLPQYRRQGIATKLREYQESWAKQAGYLEIEVKSMNCFPAMLTLLITNGYHIFGYEHGETKSTGKIRFYKTLTGPCPERVITRMCEDN